MRATGLTGKKQNPMVSLSLPSTVLAPEKMIFFFFKVLFSVRNFSSALVESLPQLGPLHLSKPCVNREFVLSSVNGGPVGSDHTLDRLANVLRVGVSVGKWLAVAKA